MFMNQCHVMWVPVTMACPWVVDAGDGLHI